VALAQQPMVLEQMEVIVYFLHLLLLAVVLAHHTQHKEKLVDQVVVAVGRPRQLQVQQEHLVKVMLEAEAVQPPAADQEAVVLEVLEVFKVQLEHQELLATKAVLVEQDLPHQFLVLQ
jgi:hypothetical protein